MNSTPFSNIWLCSAIDSKANPEQVEKWLEFSSYFDGVCATLNYDPDEFAANGNKEFIESINYKLLNDAKKGGLISWTPWVNLHNDNRNVYLQSGRIRQNDWILAMDINEYVIEDFAKGIRERVEQYNREKVGYMYWNRPYLFKFNNQMLYRGNPHEVPHPLVGKGVILGNDSKIIREENGAHFEGFFYSAKNQDNAYLMSGSKYMFYRVSNQMDMFYRRFGEKILKHHENLRQWFLLYCEFNLGFIPSLDNVVKYFEDNLQSLDTKFVDYVEMEYFMKDIFRFKVLKQSRHTILKQRHNWSFKEYLASGDIDQTSTNYIGVLNVYNTHFKKPLE